MRWWRSASCLPTARSCSPATCAPKARATDGAPLLQFGRRDQRPGEIIDAVDKLHLVPGRRISAVRGLLRQLGIDRIVAMPTRVFGRSGAPSDRPSPTALRAAIFICYEIIFPDEVATGVERRRLHRQRHQRRLVRRHARPLPAFSQAQIRAADTGLPLVRAANNGISAVDRFARPRDRCASRSTCAAVMDVDAGDSRRVAAAARRSAAVNGCLDPGAAGRCWHVA